MTREVTFSIAGHRPGRDLGHRRAYMSRPTIHADLKRRLDDIWHGVVGCSYDDWVTAQQVMLRMGMIEEKPRPADDPLPTVLDIVRS